MSSTLSAPISAARWAPRSSSPASSPRVPLLIRAPLTTNSSSSGSELDPLSSSDEGEGSGFGSESETEAEAAPASVPAPSPATGAAEAGPSLIPVARVTYDDDVDESEESSDEDGCGGFYTVARVSAPLIEKYAILAGNTEGGKVEILGPVVEGVASSVAVEKYGASEDSEREDLEPSDSKEVGFLGESRPVEDNSEKDSILGGSPILERTCEPEKVEVFGSTFNAMLEGGMGSESMYTEADAIEMDESGEPEDLKLEKVHPNAAEEIDRISGEGKEAGILGHNGRGYVVRDMVLDEMPILQSNLAGQVEKIEILGPELDEVDAASKGGMSSEAARVDPDAIEEAADGVDEDLKHENMETDDADTEETGRVLGEDPNQEEHNEDVSVLDETHTIRENAYSQNLSLLENNRVDGGVEPISDDFEGSGIMFMHGVGERSGDIDTLNGKAKILQGVSEQISYIIDGEMGSNPPAAESNIIEPEKDEYVESNAVEAERVDSVCAEPNQNCGPAGEDDPISIGEPRIKPYSKSGNEAVETLNEVPAPAPADALTIVEDFSEYFDALSETDVVSDCTIKMDPNLIELHNGLVAESGGPIISKNELSDRLDKGSNTLVIEGVFDDSPRTAQNSSHFAKSEAAIMESTEAAEQLIEVMNEGSSNARNYSHNVVTSKIVLNTYEKVDTNIDEGKELLDTATLIQLLRIVAAWPTNGNTTNTTFAAANLASANYPAGLGSSVRPLKPVRPKQTFTSQKLEVANEIDVIMTEKEKKFHEEIESIRVKFLRIVLRLGRCPDDNMAASVLYYLANVEDTRNWLLGFSCARKKAVELEREEKDKLNFSCNILIIGKTGVGKSATVNSIFEEVKSLTNPFEAETNSVRKIEGVIDGIKIQIIDTPGLCPCLLDQQLNRKILSSVKNCIRKCTPDVVLYVDRLDTRTQYCDDLPLLRMTTDTLGSSIWSKAIIVLTHAAASPPEGSSGLSLSYEASVAQKSQLVQQLIRQAAGNARLINPVALVENHPSCRRNRQGQRVLPNGSSWRSLLLLLCYSSKILSEANSLSKVKVTSLRKVFGRFRSPPMPLFMSSLLERKAHTKLSSSVDVDVDLDIELDDISDQENEEKEYDQLPPFRFLTKSQIAKLTKVHKRAYFDEYDYRAQLFKKKQRKEEIERLKELQRKWKSEQDDTFTDSDNALDPITTPFRDMVLLPSFDCDDAVYRCRSLGPSSQLLTAPILDPHGWDHDCSFDSVSLENTLNVAGQFPSDISGKLRKDKKEFSIHMDSSILAKHGEIGSTLASYNIETVGDQLSHCFRADTRFGNLKKNKTTAGISVNFLGDTVATGLKLEDQVSIGKRVNLSLCTGAVQAEGNMGYGAILEATLKEKDAAPAQALTRLSLSLVKYHRNLVLGGTLLSHVSVGRNSIVSFHVGLNNKKRGQLTIKTSSSEQIQIVLVGLIPIIVSIFKRIWPGNSSPGTRYQLLD